MKKTGKYIYPIIKITNKFPSFIREITSCLRKLDFRVKYNISKRGPFISADLVLHGHIQKNKWYKEIIKK